MTDKKYPIVGYAPGNYQCKCVSCGAKFLGDKMAVQCEPCAENSMADHALVVEAMDFYWRHFKKELSRNDLGDIERKQYELIENRLKEYIIKHTE